MSRRTEKINPLVLIAVGALILAAGVWLARQWLPEWRTQPLEKAEYVRRYQELARQAGVRLQPGAPRVFLTTDEEGAPGGSRILDAYDPDLIAALGGGVRIQVEQDSAPEEKKRRHMLQVEFSPGGQPRRITWAPLGFEVFTTAAQDASASPKQIDRFARLLLVPGETLGGKKQDDFPRNQEAVYPIQGSRPVERLAVQAPSGEFLMLTRRSGAIGEKDRGEATASEVLGVVPVILFGISIPILFLVLITRRRIGLVNGAILAGISWLAALTLLIRDPNVFRTMEAVFSPGFRALWVFMVWSVGESLLRAVQPGFTTSLDALRTGRLGPRGGRALLYGVAFGAAFAGLRLTLNALAQAAPGIWPQDPEPRLPVFGGGNPFLTGVMLAGFVAIVAALAWRWLPPRWAPWVAILGGAVAIRPLEMAPYPVELASGLVVMSLLVFILQRFGLTALLIATVSSYLLPAAVFSWLYFDWLSGTFVGTAGISAAFLVLGFVGMRRPERVEIERVRQPAFIRRLEEERRVKYEMDLLSRMQLGLLPAQLPEIPGWEIAARSLLATEAGGDLYDVLPDEDGNLWIATGDVAGHGYSCAIAQSMTVAALTSLVDAARTPSEVLRGVDRVIRRSGIHRHFTSLALMRLDAGSGDALLSNAGHPFPLLLSLGGDVLEINLPGLPLGQGPKRKYGDISIEIPLGGALVFASDGLFEGADWQENQYGYDRPQELLRSMRDASAQDILEALFTDWRRHLGEREHQDDTTVLVIKRK